MAEKIKFLVAHSTGYDGFDEYICKPSPFHITYPGDAEYSEYVDARLISYKTREMDHIVVYSIEVNLGKMRWCVQRRYSEFRELRQYILKQLAKRQSCGICSSTLKSMEYMKFPPKKPFYSSGVDMNKRQIMLHQFVAALVGLIQMFRQHQLLMMGSKQTKYCDVTDLLRTIEDFLELNFTRYTHFLAERGVLKHDEVVRIA